MPRKSSAMKSCHVSVFEKTVQKSELWIQEMLAELKWMDADGVYHLLRAVLQTLRDQLSVEEVAQLAAQLPLILRGTFYESWSPKMNSPKSFSKEEFFSTVQEKMGPVKIPNFDLESGVVVAVKVLMSHVSPGEMKDVMSSLKPNLRAVFEKAKQISLEA